MRTDQYLITINKRGAKVEQDWNGPLSKPIPMADYDALIAALQRWRDDHQKQVDYWGVEEPTSPPEWHEPAPAPMTNPVTYTVKWQGRSSYERVEPDGVSIPHDEAVERVQAGNLIFKNLNHWAIGTDGSIIGYVGAPK